MTHLLAVPAVALLAFGLAAPAAADPGDPTCRAHLKGSRFTTSIEFGKGRRVEAVWKLTGYVRPEDSNDPSEIAAELLLQTMTETSPARSRPRTITPAEPLRVQAVAGNPVDALDRAAESWCSAMHRASLEGVSFDGAAPLPRPGRIS
jgi:hypothetical protein